MESGATLSDLTVLLLHNVDSSWESADIDQVTDAVDQMKSGLLGMGHRVVDVSVKSTRLSEILDAFHPDDHVVFNWCEELPGVPRSDFMVAQILERMKFTYTGSPPEVLALSWDKVAVKKRIQASGIPTPHWQIFADSGADGWRRYPAIVKPAFEHCSNGITPEAVVLDPGQLRKRIAYIRKVFGQPALVEDFIDGREFHVTLWGNGFTEMLPPAEMDFSAFGELRDRLCTFDSKFTPGSRHYEQIETRIPAVLNEAEFRELERTAEATYRLFGCRDYARIDLRLLKGTFYVLDVNPNADISPDTSIVYAAEAAGLTYGAVASRLVDFAAQRHPFYGRRTKTTNPISSGP
jgi:D-alanine-D-alanine ligase